MIVCKRKALGCFAALALLATDAAIAQQLEDIVVTAQRREQSLQEVGVSVTAFVGDQIRELGFVNTVDVTAMTPGLNYTVPNAESSQINFFLRGVGLNDFADAQENPVAVYIDDIYKPAMGGLHLQLFDMERIEVLRGPQGALFGRNTTGGVIHYITKKPTEDFEAYTDVSIGDFSQVKAEGALSGPLAEHLLGRLSVGYHKHDPYVKNRTPGVQDYNGTDSYALRGQLRVLPTDRVDLLLSASLSENSAEVGAWQHEAAKPSPDGNTSLPLPPTEDFWGTGPGLDAFGYRDTDGDPWAGDYDRNGRVIVRNKSLASNLKWSIGNLDLSWITGWTKVNRLQEEDTEMNPFAAPLNTSFVAPTFKASTETISTEFRVAGGRERLRWTGGLYYFNNRVHGKYFLDTSVIGFVQLDADYVQDTESWALFGQVEFDLADQWTLIAGLRYTDEQKEMDYEAIDQAGIIAFCSTVDPAPCGAPSLTPISPWRPTPDHAILFNTTSVGDLAKHDTSYVTGKIELDWKPKDDLLVYGSYSRGEKSPGFNSGFLDTTFVFGINPLDTIPFGEEKLNAFEVGVKSTVLGGTTRLNAAGFYYDYQDFQTFQFLLLNQVIFNTDAEVFGGELEIQSSPAEGWDLAFGMSFLDATAKDIPTLSGDALRERDMVAAPKFSLNALVRYEWPAFGGMMAVQGWGNYQDEIWYDIQNHPISKEDGYGVVNARVSYTSEDNRFQVYAFVDNIFEEKYKTYTFDFAGVFGFNQVAYGKPRWWGLGARLNFGGAR